MIRYTDSTAVTEKRSVNAPQANSTRQNAFLEFPPFHQNILLQSSWNAPEHTGRIKVLLSEQLVRKSSGLGELDFGAANDIVCFSFQHAPRGEWTQTHNSLASLPAVSLLHVPSLQLKTFLSKRASHGQFETHYTYLLPQVAPRAQG